MVLQNVEKAKKEIEKIEAEEAREKDTKKTASGAATPALSNGGAATATENGNKSDDNAVDEVTEHVKEANLEEKKGEEIAAA